MQIINTLMFNLMARMGGVDKDESGQTLVEYGLILALISIAAIAIMGTVGGNIVDVFTTVSDELAS